MENQLLSKYPQKIGRVVLIVDKDAVIREMLSMALCIEKSYYGYHVSNALDALHFTRSILPDLMIIDYELSDMTGLQLYDQIHQKMTFFSIPCILLNAPFSSLLLDARPLWILQEPFDLDTLLKTVKQAVSFSSHQGVEIFS